jgi:uncharacterized protein YjiS (DUF1127 family)
MSGVVFSRRVAALPRPVARDWLGWLSLMLQTIETRRQLAEMDTRMLQDIGITHVDAVEEANRAPWELGPPPPA